SHLQLTFTFHDPAATALYTLSLHDALPISLYRGDWQGTYPNHSDGEMGLLGIMAGYTQDRAQLERLFSGSGMVDEAWRRNSQERSEEHTSELQSLRHLVCRLLLEKKKKIVE